MSLRIFSRNAAVVAAVLTVVGVGAGAVVAAPEPEPFPGAIFTTDDTCGGTNVNIFGPKSAVHLDGGPRRVGAAGLPDGQYYVKVTQPDGTVLGTSVGLADETPLEVHGGEFGACYQLTAVTHRASDPAAASYAANGFDNSATGAPNDLLAVPPVYRPHEYKVWVSTSADFASSASKTDNFKALDDIDPGSPPQVVDTATLKVEKFYDKNANGLNDDALPIAGWRFHIQDGIDFHRFSPVQMTVDPDDYTVTESVPAETNWLLTTANPQTKTLAKDTTTTFEFGNLCLGAGRGHTLGFWSNKNGQALITETHLATLRGLNLRRATGAAFDPTTRGQVKDWLLSATATNMAYMLSAQLAAMHLNVSAFGQDPSQLIHAPGTLSANALGFASVSSIMSEANTSLGLDGSTPAGSPARALQEALKTALDRANNNLTFVQGSPCAFSFAPLP